MTRAHDKAVLSRLRAGADLAERVFEVEVPKTDASGHALKTPQFYVLLHSNRGIVTADRLAGPARRRRKTYWIHSVGLSKGQVDRVGEVVLQQLLNFTPEVEGWQCERMTHEASQPVQKDSTVSPALFFGVDQFDFVTTPLDQ